MKEIQSLTNPTIRSYFLEQYADKCDTAAVSLKAAAVPRQTSVVILPLLSIKPTEIYAPNYKQGETVVLIRYPHGGTFEIPELRVNNSNKEAQKIFKNARDAVGIHPSVAERLSGADFDGDTVLVIPNNNRSFKTSRALEELKGFEPKELYRRPEGTTPVKHATAQKEMGVVTNLITDMTLRGATDDEIARAVKYSMVVIDAEKHNLDYKQAKRDCDIDSLQKKYQQKEGGRYGGASTLISRASAQTRVPERKKSYRPDPETGKYIYTETGQTYVNKKGKTVAKTTKTEQMRTVDDAHELSSGTVIESIYADYANSMKNLAAEARKEAVNTKGQVYSPEAAKKYAKEVESLNAKVIQAKAHAPKERKAQLLANTALELRKADNPDMTKEQIKKYKSQALADARASLGGAKPKIHISDKEWEAIQAGAISKTKLQQIMQYSDQDELKERALPHNERGLTDAQISRAKMLLTSGYTLSEVAETLGVSTSTIQRAIYE